MLTVSVGAGDATGGSTAQYFVGDFDGTTFVRDPSVSPETVDARHGALRYLWARTLIADLSEKF